MKKYILICIAFVATAFAAPSLDDLTFEWVAPSQHAQVAPELRNLIRINNPMQFSLLGKAIAEYFKEAIAIAVTKDGDRIVGFCSISELYPAESTLEIECGFVDPSYKDIGISETLTDLMFERYSDCNQLLWKPLGFANFAWR